MAASAGEAKPSGATEHAPIVCDLDGVVWLGGEPVPGAADAVARLRLAGHPVVFITNNSYAPVSEIEAKLAAQGIEATGAVRTSAAAAASLVEPGERVLVCGGPGLVEALVARGAVVVDDDTDVDALVVGFHRSFDYERMRLAAEAVRKGARFVASNDDATFPTPQGLIPGCGAIVAGVATAAGVEPLVAGKPYPPMAALVRQWVGHDGIVVGDRPDTDGRLARALGFRFVLVLTGVTAAADLPVAPAPDLVAADLAATADELLGQRS